MSVMGMDLGSSASVMCIVKNGAVDTVINEASKRKSPSLISFHNGQRYIGEPAVSLTTSNYKNTVSEIRRLVGRQWSDAETQRDVARFPNASRFKALPNGQLGVEVDHDSQTLLFDGTSLLAMNLGGLRRTAERTLSEHGKPVTVRDCVLSVPPYFTDLQRRAVLDAGKVAGLNVLRLLNSTSAVALDYGMWKNARNVFDAEKRTLVMFVDVGYSDTHVSLAAYVKGKVHVLSVTSDRELGGRDIDAALAERFAKEFEAKTKLNPRKDPKAMIKLGAAAEKAKQTLTPEGVTKAEVYVEYLMNETDLKTVLTTEDLDLVLAPLVGRLPAMIARVLEEAKVQSAELHSVEMVGGSSRIRAFKKAVGTALQLDTSKAPNFGCLTTLNADESVGRGCALMCAMLSPQFKIATTFEVVEQVHLPIRLEWEQPASPPPPSAADDNAMEEEPGQQAATSSHLVILSRADEPKTRRVTFRRSDQFDIVAKYEEPLPEHLISKAAPRDVLKVTVSGMQANAAAKGRIAVEFAMTKSGVFNAVSAVFQETVDEPGATPEAPPKKKTVKTALVLTQTHSGVTDTELTQMMTREAELAAKDKALRERADKRNALEEFIYRARDSIDSELKPYATANEQAKLKEQLDQDEAWLYEHGDEAAAGDFDARLNALRAIHDRAADRLAQVDARAKAAERLSATVQELLQVVNSASPDLAHLSDEERNTVRFECDEALSWVNANMQKQGALPLYQDPVLSSFMIDDKASALKNKCRPITQKPKPAPPKTSPPPPQNTPTPPTGTPPPSQEEANGQANGQSKPEAEADAKKKKEGDMDLD